MSSAAPLALTPARRAVLAVLERETSRQISAQQIHQEARRIRRRIGLATVYRALAALSEAGLIETVSVEHGEAAYRLCSPVHHHHFLCTSCGAVVEVSACGLRPVERKLADRYGVSVEDHDVTFRGRCTRCAEKKAGP